MKTSFFMVSVKSKRESADYGEIMKKLKFLSRPENVEGMAKFGINPKNNYGISVPELRAMGKRIGKNHGLALRLWDSGIRDARLLACFIAEPKMMTENQMEKWARDFDSWDVCDQCCLNVFSKSVFSWKKAFEWSSRKEEFVKRAGFALMAILAVHDKEALDRNFLQFFPLIKRESVDGRNYVRKAVNWALRQIGKRNENLRKEVIILAKEISGIDSPSARWIGSDALRELERKGKNKKRKNNSQ